MHIETTRWGATAVSAAAALVLTACGSDGDAGAGGTQRTTEAAAAGGPTVVAGFYPLQWAAERIGGDRVDVSSLTPPGAEAHDLELTPQDVAAVSEANLLVYLAGFQPAIDDAATSQAGDAAWDAGQAADLSLTAAEEAHEGETEAEHAEHAEEGGREGAEEPVDPHFWLDPVRLAGVGDALAERLAQLDPDGAATYEQNAAALRADLDALHEEMQAGLADCAVDTMVTSHDAFGYLADRYGFEVVGISGLNPSDEPSPAQLGEISELVGQRGVTTVYTETLVDPAVAETVAAEAGVQTAVLDPIEGITDESAGDDYLEVMRANLTALREGQSCT